MSGRPQENNQLSGNTHLSAEAARNEHARRTRMDRDRTTAREAIARELPHSTSSHENGWMTRPNETDNVIPVDSPSAPAGVEHQLYNPPTARGTRPEPLSHSIAVGNGDYVHQVATGERVTVTTPLGPDGQPARHDILRSTGFCSCAGIAVRARGPHGESLTIGHAEAGDAGAAEGGQFARLTGEVTRALDAQATDVAVFANIDRAATTLSSRAEETALHSFPVDSASLAARMRIAVAAHLGPNHTVTVDRGGLVIVGPDGVRRTVSMGVQLRPVPPGRNASPSMSALQVTADGILVTDAHGGATHWSWDSLPGPYIVNTPNQGMPPANNGGTPPAGTPPSNNGAPPSNSGGPAQQAVPPMNQSDANAIEAQARPPAPNDPPARASSGLAQLGAGGAVAGEPSTPSTAHAAGPSDGSPAPAPPPPRVEHLIEAGPRDQEWTLTIENGRSRLSRAHPPMDIALPPTVPQQAQALVDAGVRRAHAVEMVREIARARGVVQDRLYVSYASNNATARDHVINTVRNQVTGMSATTGPLPVDRRRALVVNHTAMSGGDPLSGFAVVYAELPTHPFTHQAPRNEVINGQTIARPGESEYRPNGGPRQVAAIEALGAIEVDDHGRIVEIVAYSDHLTNGQSGFVDLLTAQGWTLALRTPPTQPPQRIVPDLSRNPR